MFNFMRNGGDKRSFEYADELKMCPSGKVVRVPPPEVGEAARLVLADALYQTAMCSKRMRMNCDAKAGGYPLDPERILTEDVWQDCQGQLYSIIKNQ